MDSELEKFCESMKVFITDELTYLELELTSHEVRVKEEQAVVRKIKLRIKDLQKQQKFFLKWPSDKKPLSSSNPASAKNNSNPASAKNNSNPVVAKNNSNPVITKSNLNPVIAKTNSKPLIEKSKKPVVKKQPVKKVLETKKSVRLKALRTITTKAIIETQKGNEEKETEKDENKEKLEPEPVLSNKKAMTEEKLALKVQPTVSDIQKAVNIEEKSEPSIVISKILVKEEPKPKLKASDSELPVITVIKQEKETSISKPSVSQQKVSTPHPKGGKTRRSGSLEIGSNEKSSLQKNTNDASTSKGKTKAQLDKKPNQQKLKNMVILSSTASWDLVSDEDSLVLKGIQKKARFSLTDPPQFSPITMGLNTSIATDSTKRKRVSFAPQSESAFFNTSSPPISLDTSVNAYLRSEFDGSYLSTIRTASGSNSQGPVDLTVNSSY